MTKPISIGTITAMLLIGFSTAWAQEGVSPYRQPERVQASSDRIAANPQYPRAQAPSAENASQGMAAIQKAAVANKYLFVFFWKEKNRQTDAMWPVFQGTTSKLSDWTDWVAIRVGDPAEKPIVDRFDASRAPMPLVLAIAANGAVTRGFAAKFDESQLRQAFVSPCTEQCLKALQDRRLVLLCVQSQGPQPGQVTLLQGVTDFTADARFARSTQVIVLNPGDPTEASFLRELQVDPRASGPLVVFLAPPGSLIGKFDGQVTKDQLAAKLAAAQSNPCAGGKCGPNGCGPKR